MKFVSLLILLTASCLVFAETPVAKPAAPAIKSEAPVLQITVDEQKDVDLLRKDVVIAKQATALIKAELQKAEEAEEQAEQALQGKITSLRVARKLTPNMELAIQPDPTRYSGQIYVFQPSKEGKQ
jgi:hypothetical protein